MLIDVEIIGLIEIVKTAADHKSAFGCCLEATGGLTSCYSTGSYKSHRCRRLANNVEYVMPP